MPHIFVIFWSESDMTLSCNEFVVEVPQEIN